MMKNIFALGVVAAMAFLAGCQREPAGPSAAANQESQASEPQLTPQRPLALSEAFGMVDDVARALDASELHSITMPLQCSVDSVNETRASEAAVSKASKARFSGFVEAKAIAQPSILILRSEVESYFVKNTPTTERADIATSKAIADGSAFDYSTYAALDNVAPGSYTIDLVVMEGGKYRRCASSEMVSIQ